MTSALRVIIVALVVAVSLSAQAKRVLFITHSAGFRHDSIVTATEVLRSLSPTELEVTATEDLSSIAADALRAFDAVFFFTSGELPLTSVQKRDLLGFVRSGKGFGGAHSATDTLYTWPEYKELIGATFDGHPWAQRIRIDVEDTANPIVGHLAPGFEIADEIYQHRDFSRNRVRVLMTLDTTSVDLGVPGVNRTDGDFALAWVQPYGQGRVFYTALGHVDETWRDARFQQMLRNALLWLTGQIQAPSDPRPPAQPRIAADSTGIAVGNAATLTPRGLSPGTIFSIFGDNLTPGSEAAAVTPQPPLKLGGAMVLVNGQPVPVFYASRGQINALAPASLTGTSCSDAAGQCVQLEVVGGGAAAAAKRVGLYDRTPGIFVTTANPDGTATIWATGLGAVRQAGSLFETVWRPRVEINGAEVTLLFSGLAPGWSGLYQINVRPVPGVVPPFVVRLRDE
jgi:uncharacterized protein (TIGR03437 family)